MGDSVYLAAGSDLASFELCLSILLDVDMSFNVIQSAPQQAELP